MRVVSTMSTKTSLESPTRSTTTRRSTKNKETKQKQKQDLKSYCKSVVKNIVDSTSEELILLETKMASLERNKGSEDDPKVFLAIHFLHKKLLSVFVQLTRYRWSFSDNVFMDTEVDECFLCSKTYLSASEKCNYVNTFLDLEKKLLHSLSKYVVILGKRCENNGVNNRKNNGSTNTGSAGAKTGNAGTNTARRGTNNSLSLYSSAHKNPSSRSATSINTKRDMNDGLSSSFSAYESASSRSIPSRYTKGDRNDRGRLIKIINMLKQLGVKVTNMSLFDDGLMNAIGQVGRGESMSNDLCEILEEEKKLLQSTKELRTVRESILDSKDISDLCKLESVRQSLGGFHMKPSQPIPNNNTTLHLRGVPVSTSRSALHH